MYCCMTVLVTRVWQHVSLKWVTRSVCYFPVPTIASVFSPRVLLCFYAGSKPSFPLAVDILHGPNFLVDILSLFPRQSSPLFCRRAQSTACNSCVPASVNSRIFFLRFWSIKWRPFALSRHSIRGRTAHTKLVPLASDILVHVLMSSLS
jgi:hypothetical protein